MERFTSEHKRIEALADGTLEYRVRLGSLEEIARWELAQAVPDC